MGIKKLEHTAIIVKNLEESIQFYKNVLNFELRTTGQTEKRKLAFLYVAGSSEVEIELIEELTEVEGSFINGVIDHIAFLVEDLDETMKDLESKGIHFIGDKPTLTAFGKRNIMFKGLNGELLQIIEG